MYRFLLGALFLLPVHVVAAPDTYVCDTAIYGGETAHVKPNVLIILDTSGSMSETIPVTTCNDSQTGAYDPAFNYTASGSRRFCGELSTSRTTVSYDDDCRQNTVYECRASNFQDGRCTDWREVTSLTNLTSKSCSTIRTALQTDGKWGAGRTRIDSSTCSPSSSSYIYATGNWIVWYNKGSSSTCSTTNVPKITIAKTVVKDIVQNTPGVNLGLMIFNSSTGTRDGGRFPEWTIGGQSYRATVKDMEAFHAGGTTNRQALISLVENLGAPSGWTPLAETLYEAMLYFKGAEPRFNTQFGTAAGTRYPSPITASCQPNYVVFITDGMSTKDTGISGDLPNASGNYLLSNSVFKYICDNTGCGSEDVNSNGTLRLYGNSLELGTHFLDNVSQYLYNKDLRSDFSGRQNVRTFTVGFGLSGTDRDYAIPLLDSTAAKGGGGQKAFVADDYQGLIGALTSIFGEILSVDTSFVAPVVPTSPENRTASGNRVYLGFFKPVTGKDWLGNLKKFGFNASGQVIDKNGNVATGADGRILENAVSFWSGNADGGEVTRGGVGEKLLTRGSPRKMFTFLANPVLGADENTFDTSNSELLARIGGTAAAAEKIVKYVRGLDVYDENMNGNTTEVRSWILGDILHSKPLVLRYAPYSAADEGNPSKNKTLLIVGSNSGPLHAFSDADGQELWSFVPPSLLPALRYLGDGVHNYFMDSTPVAYVYDKNKDGTIDPLVDRILLLVGMRRGGGSDTLSPGESRGSYYALDLTDPLNPRFLWELNSTRAGFGELGETWSEPVFGKVRVDNVDRVVAVIGAGYDNNEDLRFGNTQSFPNTTTSSTITTSRTNDAGAVTSAGTARQVNPRGRGIYILELATLDAVGAPSVHTAPVKLWEYVYTLGRETDDPVNNPSYSFPGAVTALDSDFDGYLDLVYAGDTGGNLWRFSIGNRSSTANWTGRKIFSANPSHATVSGESPVTNGRRIFSPASVVLEPGYVGLYFGTGDRAHPLNKAVTDRLYAIYDRFKENQPAPITEAHLVNVTENLLQAANPPAPPATCTETDTSQKCLLQRLYDPSRFGWFVRLNENGGEKVLAPALVFNRVAYFTTFTPNIATDDPCAQGNLGMARVYAVNYKTGEAAFNFDLGNDTATNTNERSKLAHAPGAVLRRSDRLKAVGGGVPSGVVVLIRDDGTSMALVGSGGGISGVETKQGGLVVPMYWMMK